MRNPMDLQERLDFRRGRFHTVQNLSTSPTDRTDTNDLSEARDVGGLAWMTADESRATAGKATRRIR